MYTSSYNESALYTVSYSCGCETQFGFVYDEKRRCMMFGVSKELECIEGNSSERKCAKSREVGYAKDIAKDTAKDTAKETSNAAKKKA